MREGDSEAFHFPQRVWGGFVVSTFTIAFLAINIDAFFQRLRDAVRQADMSATSTIYYSLNRLQEQFLLLTNVDMPIGGNHWVDYNVEKVHDYLVSLADAIYISSKIGSAVGAMVVAISWVVLCLDFRAQVSL